MTARISPKLLGFSFYWAWMMLCFKSTVAFCPGQARRLFSPVAARSLPGRSSPACLPTLAGAGLLVDASKNPPPSGGLPRLS